MKCRPQLRSALLLLVVGLAARAQPVVIRAGRLVDPATGTASTGQQILVEDGVIRAVGASVSPPAGAQVVDLSDRAVLPGLMDAHTHLCLTVATQGGKGIDELLQRLLASTLLETNARRALVGAKNARDMLESGFTTVRDVGNAGNYADTDQALTAPDERLFSAPRTDCPGYRAASPREDSPAVTRPARTHPPRGQTPGRAARPARRSDRASRSGTGQ